MKALAIALIAGYLAFGQGSLSATRVREAETTRLLGLARASQSEFAADLIVRLSTGLPVERARDLLRQAFQYAENAKIPMKLLFVGGLRDSVDGARARWSGIGLDRLSLQARIVTEMMAIDRVEARDMFRRLRVPSPSPSGCEALVVPDFGQYYAILNQVTEDSYSPEEVRKGLFLELWRSHLLNIRSLAQIESASSALVGLHVTEEQRSRLADLLAMSFRETPVDPRYFSSRGKRVLDGIRTLLRLVDPHARNNLLRELRPLVLKHAAANLCSAVRAISVNSFNALVGSFSSEPGIVPIRRERFRDGNVSDNVPHPVSYWTTAESSKLLNQVQSVKFSSNKTLAEWRAQFREVSRAVAAWKGENESSKAVYYAEKSQLLSALATLPSGDKIRTFKTDLKEYYSGSPLPEGEFDTLVEAFINLANDEDSLQLTDPALWFGPVMQMFETVCKYRSADIPALRAVLSRRNRNATLSAYFEVACWASADSK